MTFSNSQFKSNPPFSSLKVQISCSQQITSMQISCSQQITKLADFGLSKRLKRCSTVIGLDETLGSPYWMAPEVVRASSSKGVGYGRKADIWSIGCTIIETLTCKPPWSDMEPMSAVYSIGSGRKSPEIPSNLSKSLRDFLSQTFKRDPKSRPSANDLINHPFITNEEDSIARQANYKIRRSFAEINHRLSETWEKQAM